MFEQTPDILTFKECQELLKIGKNTLLDLLHNEEIEGFKIGTRWKIPKAAVLEYISMCQNFFTFFPFCIN